MTVHSHRLAEDVHRLATDAGRMPGSSGHQRAVEYLVSRLEGIGAKPYAGNSLTLPYEVNHKQFVNIVGLIEGDSPQLSPVLIGAHFDTCGPYPGADDNAAGVAVVLAVAEALAAIRPRRSVVLALFDAEEPPYFLSPSMGSIQFYEAQRTGDVHCSIIMDLVGHDIPIPGMEDALFITGMESDPGLEPVVGDAAVGTAIRPVPTLNCYVGDLSDHHVFRINRRPYLFLTCGHWRHYHMPTDTPDQLNYSKVAAVAEYAHALVVSASNQNLCGPFEGYDTTDAELSFLRETVQPALSQVGLDVQLRTRENIDHLVALLVRQFGL